MHYDSKEIVYFHFREFMRNARSLDAAFYTFIEFSALGCDPEWFREFARFLRAAAE